MTRDDERDERAELLGVCEMMRIALVRTQKMIARRFTRPVRAACPEWYQVMAANANAIAAADSVLGSDNDHDGTCDECQLCTGETGHQCHRGHCNCGAEEI